MLSRREYLSKLNPPLATMGRGRMSAAAHAEIDRAIREDGMQFSDMPKGTATPIASKDASKVSNPAEYFGETPEPIWNGGWYRLENGKRIDVSGIAACGKCRFSLDYQACAEPIAVNNTGELVPIYRKMAG